jgi:hypothetical protein
MVIELLTEEERRERFAEPKPGAITLPLRRRGEAAVDLLEREARALGMRVEWLHEL